jgi:predicted RNase H-like HicB family nuclease
MNRAGRQSNGALVSHTRDNISVGLNTDRGYNLLMTRRVLLYPGEDGFMVAEVPSLPGCISQGRTRDEALTNVREAISLHEEVLRERGETLPEDKVELVEVAA